MRSTEYLDWNNHIAEHFFNEDMAGREVLLYVNGDVIEEIGREYGVGLQDFIEAVKKGPRYALTERNVCEKASLLCKRSQHSSRVYPLYIAYLALFVYAATIDGDFDRDSYYPKLYTVLGEPVKTGFYRVSST